MENMNLERAKTAAIARDFALAARLYKAELKNDPNNTAILRSLGDIYVKSGDDEKAIPYYENLLTFDSHDVMAMNALGAIYRRLKQYEKSIAILEQALEEDNKTAIINYTLGFTHKDMGNFDDAIDCFENVIAENPNDVLAYNHLGVIYSGMKEYGKAESTFRRGLQIDPNHPIIQYNLAHTYEGLKDYTSAGRCYENALKSKPGWSEAVIDYASLLSKCHKSVQASQLVKKCCILYPKNAQLQSLLGRIYLKQFDWENAEKTFAKAAAVAPNDILVLSCYAEALEKGGKADKAVEILAEAAKAPDAKPDLKKQYAHILLTAKRTGEAGDIIQELLEVNPKDVETLDLNAQYAICTGDTAKADEYFDEIRKLTPDYAHHYLDSSRRYFQAGNFEYALKTVNEYLNRRSTNAAAYNLKGEIYTAQKDYRMAICTYIEAIGNTDENVAAKKAISFLEDMEPEAAKEITIPEEKEEEESDLLELIEDEEFDFGAMTGTSVEEVDNASLDDLKKNEDTTFDKVAESVDALTDHEIPVENSEFTIDDLEEIDVEEFEKEEEVEPPLSVKTEPLSFEPESPAVNVEAPDLEESVNRAVDRAEEIAKSVEEAQEKILDAVAKLTENKSDDFIPPQMSEPSPLERSFTAPDNTIDQGSPFFASPIDRSISSNEPDIFSAPAFSQPYTDSDPFADFNNFGEAEPSFSDPGFDNLENVKQELEAAKKLKEARNFIPRIIKMLEDKDKAERFHSEIGLFTKLRSLSDYLAPDEKKIFMSSRTRLLMDYLVSKMSGSPGLLKTMQSLVKSGALGEDVDYNIMEKAVSGLTGDALTRKVLNDMKKMTVDLADRDLAKALCDAADEALEQV